MSNERQNDFLSWRTSLDNPDGIPGLGLDNKEAAWENLLDRLAETPRRNYTAWYIAAACFLLALLPALHHPKPVVKLPSVAKRHRIIMRRD